MANHVKTLKKLLRGNADANIRFGDLCSLLEHLGFTMRIRGGHHIFTHDDAIEIVNLQPKHDKAKPYQVRQIRNIVLEHGLASMIEFDEPNDESNDSNNPEENGHG